MSSNPKFARILVNPISMRNNLKLIKEKRLIKRSKLKGKYRILKIIIQPIMKNR